MNVLFLMEKKNIKDIAIISICSEKKDILFTKEFIKEHGNIRPNTLVYDTLIQESAMHKDYIKWWENETASDSTIIF